MLRHKRTISLGFSSSSIVVEPRAIAFKRSVYAQKIRTVTVRERKCAFFPLPSLDFRSLTVTVQISCAHIARFNAIAVSSTTVELDENPKLIVRLCLSIGTMS